MDLAARQMVGLNPTAGYVWQMLDGTVRLERLAERLPALELAELERFCAELGELGLLAAPGPPTIDGDAESGEEQSPPATIEPPAILWREAIHQAAATCALFPASSVLCNQAPFS